MNLKMGMLVTVLGLVSASCGNNVAFDKENAAAGAPGSVECGTDCLGGGDATPPGPGDLSVTENFEQRDQASKVDILFVVDNSPSMATEQRLLGSRFRSFISAMNGVDWQMGFTTTDVSGGRYGLKGSLLDLSGHAGQRVLTPSTPLPEQVFQATVRRAESSCTFNCPTSDEQGLKASIMAMQKSTTENRVLFRPGVDLVLIYISDEDELSSGPSRATKPREVVNAFTRLWGQTKALAAYGLIIEPNDQDCLDQKRDEGSTAYYGKHVFDLAKLTGGMTGSLCQSDYSSTLEEISQQVRQLVDSFELRDTPKAIESVTLIPAQNIGWRLDGKRLKFERPPANGTQIRVRYKLRS